MSHHDHVEIDTKKEIIQLLIGIVLFLAMVLLIGVSAFLRPAGDHVKVEEIATTETATASTTATASAPTTEQTATATASATASAAAK